MSGEYIVHKAVELKNVHKARGLTLEHVQESYWRQAKLDGCHTVVIVGPTGGVQFLSRTGETVHCFDHITEAMSTMRPGVYFGEAWLPDLPFAEISGIFRRKSEKAGSPRLGLHLFDHVYPEEWEDGRSPRNYLERWRALYVEVVLESSHLLRDAPVYLVPTWEADSDKFREVGPEKTLEAMALHFQGLGGYDGLICRDPEGLWERGSGKGGEIIKIKPTLRVSCQVVSYEEGLGKHAGRIGTLLVNYNGRLQGAGTGLKDHERDITCFGMNWRGKLVEIEALGVTADGYLREPRLKGLRSDVLEPDA